MAIIINHFFRITTKVQLYWRYKRFRFIFGNRNNKGKNLKPDVELAHYIKNELRNRNILISTDGPFDSVIKTKPALIFTKENAKKVVENIDEIIKKYYNKV